MHVGRSSRRRKTNTNKSFRLGEKSGEFYRKISRALIRMEGTVKAL